jgi:hypothetical protein
MQKNMGVIDRIVRLAIVVAVAILYFTGVIHAALAIVLGVVAVIFLLTSVVGTCPLYLPLKLSTRESESK